MIKHIVMWRVKEASKFEDTAKIKAALGALPAQIPEIVEFEVGINYNPAEVAFDVALYSAFANKEDLKIYADHPAHLDAKVVIGSVAVERCVADYEV